MLERFADPSLTCPANGLNAKATPVLKVRGQTGGLPRCCCSPAWAPTHPNPSQTLCDEFNDLKSLDKIAGVQVRRGCCLWGGRPAGVVERTALGGAHRAALSHASLLLPPVTLSRPSLSLLPPQTKVDAVTGVMQKNIEMALRNTDRCVPRAARACPPPHPALRRARPAASSRTLTLTLPPPHPQHRGH